MQADLEEEVQRDLEEIYGDEFVARQPTLTDAGVLRPDLVVYEDEQQTTPFLIVEVKSRHTGGQKNEAARQVRRYLQRLDTDYGAVVYEDLQYIFRLTEIEGNTYEIPLADFPPFGNTHPEAVRGIESVDEFWFLLDRVKEITEISYEDLLQHLYRKFEADRQNRYVDPSSERFTDFVQEIDNSISERRTAYSPAEAPIDSPQLDAVFRVFGGFDLAATDLTVRNSIVDAVYENQLFDTGSGTYATPSTVAEQLVELSEITGTDEVLDPASGWGYMLRRANLRTDHTYGIEINPQVNNVALFFDDFTNGTSTYFTGNFFDVVRSGADSLPNRFDNILLDPPLGLNLSSEDVQDLDIPEHAQGAEGFVIAALNVLKDGGTLTAVLPTTSLSNRQSQWFRKRIWEEYDLKVIVEVGNAKLFPFLDSRYSLSIVQIRKYPPSDTTAVEIVGDKDDPASKLSEAIDRIQSGEHRSLQLSSSDSSFVPSERIEIRRAERVLHAKYDETAPLADVATIEGGASYPGEEDEEGLPFLKTSDTPSDSLDHVKVAESTPVATETDVLVVLKGPENRVIVPDHAIVPSSDWGIARFESADAANVYASFLETTDGQRQLKAMHQGSAIPYIPLSRFGEVQVPVYEEEEISRKANQIRLIMNERAELDAAKEELAEELEEVF